MHHVEKAIKKISDGLDKGFTWIGVVFLIALTAATFIQVVGRYVFNSSPSWTDEMARYSFVWANMLGAAIALKHGHHAAIDLLPNKLHGIPKAIQKTVVDCLVTFAAGLLLVEGYKMTVAIYKTGQLSPAMRIPVWLVYISIAVGGLGMVIHSAVFLMEDCKTLVRGGEKT